MLIFSHKYTDFFTVDDRTKDKDSINGGLIKNGVKNFFKSEMLIWSLFKNISFTTNSYLIFFSVAQILGFLILKLFSIFSNICTITFSIYPQYMSALGMIFWAFRIHYILINYNNVSKSEDFTGISIIWEKHGILQSEPLLIHTNLDNRSIYNYY